MDDQRAEASTLLLGAKLRDILFEQRLAAPLLLVLAKELNRVAAGSFAVQRFAGSRPIVPATSRSNWRMALRSKEAGAIGNRCKAEPTGFAVQHASL